jgi:hypothetical protein
MSKKTYSVAGVSKLNGKFKVRFTHDLAYVKGLTKAGNTDVELLDLPKAMVKGEAVKVLLASELMEHAGYAQAIEAADQKYNGEKTVKVTAKGKAKVGKASKSPAKTKVAAEPVAVAE